MPILQKHTFCTGNSVKAQNEAQKNEIARLEDELKTKNVESEDIAKKIEAVLGK